MVLNGLLSYVAAWPSARFRDPMCYMAEGPWYGPLSVVRLTVGKSRCTASRAVRPGVLIV